MSKANPPTSDKDWLDDILAKHDVKVRNSSGKYYAEDPAEINAREAKQAILAHEALVEREANIEGYQRFKNYCLAKNILFPTTYQKELDRLAELEVEQGKHE